MNYRETCKAEHREISELIPWYVNGTIGAIDRQKLDTHSLTCAACRDEMLQERWICQAISADSRIEYMPAASFRRLQARLDEGDIGSDRERAYDAHVLPLGPQASVFVRAARERLVRRSGRRSIHRWMPWRRLAAASIAVLAVALGLVSADKHRARGRDLPSDYHTVTSSAPRAPNEVIRAVFSPTITLVELQTILEQARLQIIAGPTEAGVYSLAATSDRPVNSALALLRRHPAVRFAESTEPAGPRASGESP
jgi:hypothetical protein